tara:strand:+ start:229 stop:396 length:168 start_codon:yes stop_codon:yes gene_type:complete
LKNHKRRGQKSKIEKSKKDKRKLSKSKNEGIFCEMNCESKLPYSISQKFKKIEGK